MKFYQTILFFCFFLIFMNFSAADTIYSNSFATNSTTYSVSGWDYFYGSCGSSMDLNRPILSPFGTYAWGFNSTSGCSSGHTRQIRRDLPVNISNGDILIDFDYFVHAYNYSINAPLAFSLTDVKAGGKSVQFSIFQNKYYLSCTAPFHCGACEVYNNNNISFGNIKISIGYDTEFYSVFVNNSLICDGYMNTTALNRFGVMGLSLYNQVGGYERLEAFLDNIQIDYAAYYSDLVGEGYPCKTGSDCITGKCEFGQCVKKGSGESCAEDYECLSEICINGICSKPTLSQLLDNSKNELFGSDAKTSNIISLFIIIGISLVIIIYGRSLGALFVAAAVGMSLSFFFTFIQWLSVWILFGELFICLIIFIIIFMSRPGT